jgi:hypothetical protein
LPRLAWLRPSDLPKTVPGPQLQKLRILAVWSTMADVR